MYIPTVYGFLPEINVFVFVFSAVVKKDIFLMLGTFPIKPFGLGLM